MAEGECSTTGRVGEYKGTVAGSELDAGIAMCVPDGSEVNRGIPLKVILVVGRCGC